MTRTHHFKTITILAAALFAATALALIAATRPAEAAFPGSNGAIAFVSLQGSTDNKFQVFRMNSDGFGQTRLTDEPGHNWDPTWSPDGKKIAFTNHVVGVGSDIFQMDADGSDETNLTRAEGYDSIPAYSPSGKIAFTAKRFDDQFDIFLMTLGSNGQVAETVRLTSNAGDEGGGVISPDGRKIAFSSDRDGDEDIYVMKLAPEGPKNVPVKLTKSSANDYGPDWSPDGKQLAFTSLRTGNYEIYRMLASPEGRTNKPVNLSKNPAFDGGAAWSPDGKKIAFMSERRSSDGSTDSDIWRMRATDGANRVNLTDNQTVDTDPDWQPQP
jgi:Tol biopolymer transport system component